jgi:hypothetical protein
VESISAPMKNAGKISKRIRKMHGKYLSVYGEYGECRGCLRYSKSSPNTRKVLTVFGEFAERIYAYMENMQRALCVFSYYAKRHKSVYISVNNNTNFKIS